MSAGFLGNLRLGETVFLSRTQRFVLARGYGGRAFGEVS
jgi:hypothetical protein